MFALISKEAKARQCRALCLFLVTLFSVWPALVVACSCGQYYAERPQPNWVSSQTADGKSYIAAGASLCTGLKNLDERRADNDARASLTKMLNSAVSTREKTTIGAVGDAGYSRYKANTELTSEQILKNATIFERWTDNQNCIVYAGITLKQADLDKGKAEQLAAQQQQLMAQNACVDSSGENKGHVKEWMIERLLQQGFAFNPDKTCQVKYQLTSKIVSARTDMVKNNLIVKVSRHHQPIWNKTYSGKAVSYSQKSRSELTQLAISDSLDSFFIDLSTLKHKKVTP
ncbi:hypothetical protein ACWXWU_19765 [Shewanella sp. A14]